MSNLVSIDLTRAHEASLHNRETIEESKLCGCFNCVAIFEQERIYDWTDKGQTATCPLCGTDTVIGDAAGVSLNVSFLQRMHQIYIDSVQYKIS